MIKCNLDLTISTHIYLFSVVAMSRPPPPLARLSKRNSYIFENSQVPGIVQLFRQSSHGVSENLFGVQMINRKYLLNH